MGDDQFNLRELVVALASSETLTSRSILACSSG
jgi:hypothetical protein